MTPVGLLVAGFAWIVGTYRLRAYDLFWHLASGAWILDNRTIPQFDPFRFTSESAPWIDHAWLFQLGMRGIESVAGLHGLVLIRALVVSALAVLLLHALRRAGAPAVGAGLVTAVAILGARPRMMMRPELATLAGTLILLVLLQSFRRRPSMPLAGLMVLLVAVWANLHPGVLLAPAIAGVFLLGTHLPGGAGARRGATPPRWSWVVGLPVALGIAILVNPYGWRLFSVPLLIGNALDNLPAVNPEWMPAWAAPQPFPILCLVLLVGLAWTCRRAAGRVDPASGLAALVLTGLAVSGVRHQGLFVVGAAVFAGECLADLARHRPNWREVAVRGGWLSLASVILLGSLWCVWPPRAGPLQPRQGPYSFGFGLDTDRFPVQAANALDSLRPDGARLYNDVAFGGYLLWRGYPERQVFIDGRNEVDPSLLLELATSRSDSRVWIGLLQRHAIDGAIVRYDDRLRQVLAPTAVPGGRPATRYHTTHALLFPASRFALVHWDDLAMVFVRRDPEIEQRIAGQEYRFVHPEDRQATLDRAAADPAVLAGALAETKRRLAEDPGCRRARELSEQLAALAADGGESALAATGIAAR